MIEKPSFFSELKRRNVYKVAVAYAIVAWLLIQIATSTFPILEIPNWATKLVILVVVLGFPIALVIAIMILLIASAFAAAKRINSGQLQIGRAHV